LVEYTVILNKELANGCSHPAVLVHVIVDGASLPDFPAYGEELKQRSFLDEIAGVMLTVPVEVTLEGFWRDWMVTEDLADFGNVDEIGFGETLKFCHQLLNRNGH
jgi:hypothetical protein